LEADLVSKYEINTRKEKTMSFGPIMRFQVGELSIELAPLAREDMALFLPGMQQYSIGKYLAHTVAYVLEDEQAWFDRTREDTTCVVWGIWLIEADKRTLIGNSALNGITNGHIRQATSGSLIFRKDLWGKGIASAAHKARTWYAFHILGLHRIMSAVLHGNGGSRKALQRSGYELVYVERNTAFVDGRMAHQDNLACLNPNDPFWGQWWHGERPSKRESAARQLTRDVLTWAEANVELP
jgi:RimJ/RimL family protein N-acetyltransferase